MTTAVADREARRRRAAAVPARRRLVEPARHRALRRVGRCARRLPTRSGRRSCAAWARAAPITSCAPASRRCSSRGIPASEDVAQLERADRRARRAPTATTTPRTTRRAPTRLAGAARCEPVGRRHSGARPVRLRQGQARGADHVGVLRQRDPRHGGRECARGWRRSGAGTLPQVRRPEQAKEFKSFHNYVALPRTEAFRIEYWALEEAKLQRMPAEKEFSRKIVVVVGGGSGIGREVALQIARRGGHVVVADMNTGRRGGDRRRRRQRCRRRKWCMTRGDGSDRRATRSRRRCAPRSCSSAASTA